MKNFFMNFTNELLRVSYQYYQPIISGLFQFADHSYQLTCIDWPRCEPTWIA